MAIQKDIAPLKARIISSPGHVSVRFYSLDGQKFFVRNFIMPESFFVELERSVVNKMGKVKGAMELYRVGKQFGYRYAIFNKFPKGNFNKLIMSTVFEFFVVGGYAKSITVSHIDQQRKALDIKTRNLVITTRDGMGYIITIGGAAGIICYMNGDYALECCSRSTSKSTYDLVIADRDTLKERGFKPIESSDIPNMIDFESYMRHNLSQKGGPETASFEKLMSNGIVKQKPGLLVLEGSKERVIPVEISLLYDIENNFNENIVSEAAYVSFHNIGTYFKVRNNPYENLVELFSAFGFGIINVVEQKSRVSISLRGYPWYTDETEKTSFAMLKGAILGFLNGNTGKTYVIKSISSETVNNVFDVKLELGTHT